MRILYEDVIANNENTLPTFHKRIRIAKVMEYDYGFSEQAVSKHENLAREVNNPNVIKLKKKIVPEYHFEKN